MPTVIISRGPGHVKCFVVPLFVRGAFLFKIVAGKGVLQLVAAIVSNDCYLDGTIIDLINIKSYLDAISKPDSLRRYNTIKWICYDDQYDFYRQFSAADDILTISRQ